MTTTRALCRALAATVAFAVASIGMTGTGMAGPTDQPPCGTFDGRGCARPSARVDLLSPTFSNPTAVTNPLFPISRLQSAVLLGHVDGKPFRTETTLLPGTSTVRWNGQDVPVLVSQYVAFLDGRITEVALDRYAQADDGSVWYFGEDVFDYRKGTVALTEGTWHEGRDGPAAMIMPATPAVGDVYRTENVPGIVFEEVTLAETGKTVSGPAGPVDGAVVARELHNDGSTERKLYAPGYGEFRTSGGGDLEALALAVPTDALPGAEPAELAVLLTATGGILEQARLQDWKAASAVFDRARDAWATLQPGQPRMVAARLDAALRRLDHALRRGEQLPAEQAALEVRQSALDLALRFRPQPVVDADRIDLWTQQLRVDADAGDRAGVAGAIATLEWMRDRVTGTTDPTVLAAIDAGLHDVRAASDAGNFAAAADHAARLALWARSVTGIGSAGPPH